MREMRVWDDRTQAWVEGNQIARMAAVVASPESTAVQNYIGLQDKNRKRMCQGDIATYSLKVTNSRYGGTNKTGDGCSGVIEYYASHAGFGINGTTFAILLFNGIHDFEIIGNIKENPELTETLRRGDAYSSN